MCVLLDHIGMNLEIIQQEDKPQKLHICLETEQHNANKQWVIEETNKKS